MRVLLFAQQLVVGGTSVNSIDLAASLQERHGHEVIIFGTPGVMVSDVCKRGLQYHAAPRALRHPSVSRVRALQDLVKSLRPDVIHAWEWAQCLEAYIGSYVAQGVPLLGTDMLMAIERVLPRFVPMTYGVPSLTEQARQSGRQPVFTLLPPVDTHANAASAVDPQPFRSQLEIADDELLIVTVSRLNFEMKAESIFGTIDAVARLSKDIPVRFAIVGGGPAIEAVRSRASQVNSLSGKPTIIVVGEILDPRPAYSAAEIVVGMGGSAMRGGAFAKPVVVVGARGFSLPLSPDSSKYFLANGFYGVGANMGPEGDHFEQIRGLCADSLERRRLGQFARSFVQGNFSVESVCDELNGFLHHAVLHKREPSVVLKDTIRTSFMYMRDRMFLRRSIESQHEMEAGRHSSDGGEGLLLPSVREKL